MSKRMISSSSDFGGGWLHLGLIGDEGGEETTNSKHVSKWPMRSLIEFNEIMITGFIRFWAKI